MTSRKNDETGPRCTRSATAILRRMVADNPRMQELLEQERLNAAVARSIYNARTARGLSQAQLAELVGTSQSVIARLEDADYEGHSLSMLRRIGAALGYEVQVNFIDRTEAA